jgi:hypothetical protein
MKREKADYTMEDFRAEMRRRNSQGGRRSPQTVTATDHSPRLALDRTRIVGCTCGWRVPPGTANSDDAYAVHAAHATVTR